MRLKKLVLQGFKSFADRTEFDFPDGITVIVGPNGCGKSNVVDAIKWVLGDQRPTALRAKEMQDVIFSGTDSRRSLGFAEVTLVLDNADRTLPVAYEEVALTRRLYRSGESEYQINKNPCRLRDIRELMLDSGGGLGALTIIEQGNVDHLLRADPQERRAVIEEAAGISKYRARRKEAERKRERTRENLDRLRDVMSESETRERSLKIQAGKARRFLELSEELKKKKVVGALARFHHLSRARTEALAALEEIAQAEQTARETLEAALQDAEEGRRRLDAARTHVAQGEAQLATLIGEHRAAEERQSALSREAEDLMERADKAARGTEEVRVRIAALTQDLAAAEQEEQRATDQALEAERALEGAEAACAQADAAFRDGEAARKDLDAARAEALTEESRARNREAAEAAELRSLKSRDERLHQRAEAAQKALASLEQVRAEAETFLRSAEEELQRLDARATAAEEAARKARTQARQAEAMASDLGREAAALQARHDLLARLVEEGEGLTAGTKALLEAKRAGVLEGIRGLVADLIGDAGPAAEPLDLALGELAGAVVVENTAAARRALDWLREGRRGRARLVVLDRLPSNMAADDSIPLGAVADFEARRVVASLLNGTAIVESFEDALERAEGTAGRVVSLTGEEVETRGTWVGGIGDAGAGLVRRHSERAEVEAKLGSMEVARDEAARKARSASTEASTWEENLKLLAPELTQGRRRVREAEAARAAAEREVSARTEDAALERVELEELGTQIESAAAGLDAATADRARIEEARLELDRKSGELLTTLEERASAREAAIASSTEVRVAAARWIEKREAAQQKRAAVVASLQEADRESARNAEEQKECLDRRGRCLDEVEALSRLGDERQRNIDALAREVEGRRAKVAEMEGSVDGGQSQLGGLRKAHEDRRRALEEQRLQENEYRLKVEVLVGQVREEYGLDLEQVAAEEEQRRSASEEEDSEGPADPDALEEEIASLRQRIEKLGNVNHAALEELSQVQERLGFLRAQEADLMAADRQLTETLERIDGVCRERFAEAFEAVRRNFSEVFRKLFGGGKAEVLLQDPEDLLNTGIEILVRPPGKELRNMTLLSGGEKSLTTVAFLFAIYQAKPAPFCLMDEVDAALDEANTVRMCAMVREYARTGQFLVITHARPTMTIADTLYGVTMPEAGISRRVSVRFADVEAGRVVGLN